MQSLAGRLQQAAPTTADRTGCGPRCDRAGAGAYRSLRPAAAVHVHHVIGPERIDPVQSLLPILPHRAGRRMVARRGRGVQPQPCPAGPAPRVVVAPAKLPRDVAGRQVRLDPGVGVGLPHLVDLAADVPLVALVSQHHARRNPLAAEHQGQRRGEIFAMSAGIVDCTKSSIGSMLASRGCPCSEY